VFTAHVIQLVGRIYDFKSEPKRMSSQALAVVKDRYWGLPWYWPKVVRLDGSYPCDIAMAEGEDYLVSGGRERYGVVQVNLCSRTQPLKTAQIDLRTLDGSHCVEPGGGTLIGHVNKGRDTFRGPTPPAPNVSVTFRNLDGAFTAQSDGDGIYELQHLAPGTYTVDSRFSQNQYASSGTVSVTEGTCREAPTLLWNYDFSGLVLPGLKDYVTVKLARTSVQPEETGSIPVEPDGRFYFRNVPDGEYLLAVSGWVPGATGDFYYPGTYDRRKAARIRVVNHTLAKAGEELDFNPKPFPLIPVW
jgi:hypothetical protein